MPDLPRWLESEALDEPVAVVGIAERHQRLAQFLEIVEAAHPQQLLGFAAVMLGIGSIAVSRRK